MILLTLILGTGLLFAHILIKYSTFNIWRFNYGNEYWRYIKSFRENNLYTKTGRFILYKYILPGALYIYKRGDWFVVPYGKRIGDYYFYSEDPFSDNSNIYFVRIDTSMAGTPISDMVWKLESPKREFGRTIPYDIRQLLINEWKVLKDGI